MKLDIKALIEVTKGQREHVEFMLKLVEEDDQLNNDYTKGYLRGQLSQLNSTINHLEKIIERNDKSDVYNR